jgi:hypothetical protein
MFKFLKGSFTNDALESRSAPPPEAPQSVAPQSVKPHTDIQRELVQVVLKDTLRRHGIPFEWLTCEVQSLVGGANAEQLNIQLVLMQWHELLLRYAPAVATQLLRGLDRFEPAVDHSKYIISWRFSPTCGCPFTVMPPPLVWSHDNTPEPIADDASSVLDRRQKKRPQKGEASDSVPPSAANPSAPPRADGHGDYDRTELSPFR